jgi:hypothetical protein
MKIQWALALASTLLTCQPGAPEELKPKELHASSLEAQAAILKREAAQVDQSLKVFSLHADAYNQSKLHKRLLKRRAQISSRKYSSSVSAKASGHFVGEAIQSDSHLETDRHLQDLHELQAEYERHVNMLRGLLGQYRDLYESYAEHCDQYRAQVQRYSTEMQQANMGFQTSGFKLASTRQMAKLGASEKELIGVVRKMGVLEERSPTLPESYLCPAYDDLHAEFVRSLDELVAATKALPKEDESLALKQESARLKALQQAMEGAERLHDEQKSLQAEFAKLQKTFAGVNDQHQDLLNLSKKLPDIQLPASP